MAIGEALLDRGFVVIPGPIPLGRLARLQSAYDTAMLAATGDDIKVGSTTTRVSDLVNRGAEFDEIYTFPPLLDACRHVIGESFRLSSLLGRTLRPRQPSQGLHVDVQRESADWPLLGFILMVDGFTPDNGATCFVPGSHQWEKSPDQSSDHAEPVVACGDPGSLIVFHASTWHGHTANTTGEPRRSIQGFFIPRGGRPGTDFDARMSQETRERLSPLAHEVLGTKVG
jgi:hypothetical protein